MVDNSQPLTLLTMESPTTNHCSTTTLFILFFCLAFILMLIFFFMSLFPRFTCRDMLTVPLLNNLSLSLLHPFVSLSSESLRTSYVLSYIYFIVLSFITIFMAIIMVMTFLKAVLATVSLGVIEARIGSNEKGRVKRNQFFRSSHRRCSVKKSVSCEFCEISKKTFFTEHIRTTGSGF